MKEQIKDLFNKISAQLTNKNIKLILPLALIVIISLVTVVFSNYLLALNQKQTSQTQASYLPGERGSSTGSSSEKSSSSGSKYTPGSEYLGAGVMDKALRDFSNKMSAAKGGKAGDNKNVGNITEKNGYSYNAQTGAYTYDPNRDLRNPGSSSDGKTTPATCSFGGDGNGGCAKATSSQWGLKNANGTAATDTNKDGTIDQKDCPNCSIGIIKDNPNSPYAAGVGSSTDPSKNNDTINKQIQKGAQQNLANAQTAAAKAANDLTLANKNLEIIQQEINDKKMSGEVAKTNVKRAQDAINKAQAAKEAADAAVTAAQASYESTLKVSSPFLFLDSATASVSSFTTATASKSASSKKTYIFGNPKNNDDYIYRCSILKNKTQLKCNSNNDILVITDNIYYCCSKN